MADDFTPDEEQPQPPPNYVPALAQLSDNLADDPVTQRAVGEAAAYINDHEQQKGIVDASNAEAQDFTQGLTDFRNGLVSYVNGDPTAVHAAMRAAPPVIEAATGISGHPDADTHATILTNDLHRDLATTAITSAAQSNEGLARSLLADPRLTAVLPDDHQQQLGQYIDMQARARAVDTASQQAQQAQLADTRANHAMFTYAASLYNRETGNVVFPPRFNQAILADNTVTPQDTATLRGLYTRLATDGGADQSDPFLVSGMVRDIASGGGPAVRDVLSHAAAGNLSLDHALHLASLTADKGPAAEAHAAGLSGLLDQGRTAIMGDDPIAGGRAYGRYVNWLLPQYAQSGVAGANPEEPGFLLKGGLAAFMPKAEDMVPSRPAGERKPLRDIFSRSGPSEIPPGPSGGRTDNAIDRGVGGSNTDLSMEIQPNGLGPGAGNTPRPPTIRPVR